MKILIIKTIFVKNESFIEANNESIKSFINYIDKNKQYNITMKLFGWINNIDNMFLEKLNVNYRLFDKNYGKMYLLNNIQNFINNYDTYDIILYADHDIIITDMSILDDLVIFDELINNKKLAICSFNQYSNNRHSSIVYLNKITINNIKYYYNDNNVFVASGCFIMKPYFVPYLEKIRSTNIYGDEDILIGRTVNENNLISLISSKSVFHPFDTDKEYEEWKKNEIYKLYDI
jgi:hypothetical protein